MVNKQTAVEWLEEKLNKYNNLLMIKEWQIIIEQAKAMEKEQIEKAYDSRCTVFKERLDDGSVVTEYIPFEQYYNETFKSK